MGNISQEIKESIEDFLINYNNNGIVADIRDIVKLNIKTLEIFWEELQKSNLPKEIQKAVLLNYVDKESK